MKSISFYIVSIASFFTFALFSSYTGQTDDPQAVSKVVDSKDQLPQMIRAISLDQSFSFAGEELPMDNFDVKERLDLELMRNAYYHSSTILNIKRANRYFPMIEQILAEENMPDDLKYLAVAESSLTNATSPAGAKGFWQFMKGTAGDYKLEVNAEVDERYDLEKATKAACKYLRKYKEKFGSWTLAAAAYNMGGGRLNSEMNQQKEDSYYDLNLNSETSKYVFRIVALKTIMNDPARFGFQIDQADRYPPLDNFAVVKIDSPIPNLGDFAKKYGTTYRMLKVYNPWLRSSSLRNRAGKTYIIKIPK